MASWLFFFVGLYLIRVSELLKQALMLPLLEVWSLMMLNLLVEVQVSFRWNVGKISETVALDWEKM